MFVKQRMSQPVITAYPEMSLQEALDLMHKEQIRRLPVVDKHGKMIGIVSERVLLKAYPSDATTLDKWELHEKVHEIKIERLMTREVTTVTEDTPLEEAARIMIDQNISGMPVMRGDKLVGFITVDDIFKLFLEVLGAREPGVRVSVLAPRSRGVLYQITKAVFEGGGDIRALGIFQGTSTDNGEIFFKVDGMEKDQLEKVIAPLVEKVVDVR